jgi:hypothetical protein
VSVGLLGIWARRLVLRPDSERTKVQPSVVPVLRKLAPLSNLATVRLLLNSPYLDLLSHSCNSLLPLFETKLMIGCKRR